MPKILVINTSFQTGGAGKVARGITQAVADEGWEVLAAHSSRFAAPLSPGIDDYRIGSKFGEYVHSFYSRLLGAHGHGSKDDTKNLIAKIQEFRPDLIHIHNLHGYYLNFKVLFDYLHRCGVPVVWTLHDLWPLTGRCAFPQAADCERFLYGCDDCPTTRNYPVSFLDRSSQYFKLKSENFAGVPNLHIVSMSIWMAELLKQSGLKEYPVHIIPNGVDINLFHPDNNVPTETDSILFVASKWTNEKGYADILKLSELLPSGYKITVAGVSAAKQHELSRRGIEAIEKTESPALLADLYRKASVFVTLSRADNFPTVVLESLSCGTPVVSYDTGACREIIADGCGYVVPRGDIAAAAERIVEICTKGKQLYTAACRGRAVAFYDQTASHHAYLDLFHNLI